MSLAVQPTKENCFPDNLFHMVKIKRKIETKNIFLRPLFLSLDHLILGNSNKEFSLIKKNELCYVFWRFYHEDEKITRKKEI